MLHDSSEKVTSTSYYRSYGLEISCQLFPLKFESQASRATDGPIFLDYCLLNASLFHSITSFLFVAMLAQNSYVSS